MNCANYSALLLRQKLISSHILSLLPLHCVLLGSFCHHRHHHFRHIARCSRCSASLFCSVCSVFFVYIVVILFTVCYLSRWIKLFISAVNVDRNTWSSAYCERRRWVIRHGTMQRPGWTARTLSTRWLTASSRAPACRSASERTADDLQPYHSNTHVQ